MPPSIVKQLVLLLKTIRQSFDLAVLNDDALQIERGYGAIAYRKQPASVVCLSRRPEPWSAPHYRRG